MDVVGDHGGGIFEALNGKIYGNGTETLVLSHGFGADQSVWHYLMPYLACYFKVVVFDLVISPNVNPNLYHPKKYSNFTGYARDLVSLLDELNINNTIFIGHSMSAMIGCIAAIERPELFQHLILLGGSPRYVELSFSIEIFKGLLGNGPFFLFFNLLYLLFVGTLMKMDIMGDLRDQNSTQCLKL